MQRTQIYLPKTQLTQLKEIARRKDTTTSAVIRLLLQEAFHVGIGHAKKQVRRTKKKTLYDDTKAILKKLEKIKEEGPSDLAQNMDKYLYGGI